MPNAFAILVLALSPLAVLGLFKVLSPGRALLAVLFGCYLLLPPPPTEFDFPLIPILNKENLPSIAALCGAFLFARQDLRLMPESRMAQVLLAVFILSPAATSVLNTSPVFYGTIGLPGLGIKDAISLMMQQFILVLPMLLARSYLSQAKDQRDLIFAFMIGGLFYSLPMLVEIRLAPQLNIWIYGYFQHSFEQMMRYGGFRPIVFLYHGLWAAFFMLMAICAAATIVRSKEIERRYMIFGALIYLFGVLVLCKSAGSLLYAIALVPMLLLLPRKLQVKIALGMATLAIAYPILKGLGAIPEREILELAASYSPDRAQSLGYRLDNETTLLNRAEEKPVFGWGSWGRNLILDPVTGEMLTVPDGRWIIVLGVYGWVGFAAEIGLIALPMLLAAIKLRATPGADWPPYAAGLCLMLGINLIDFLPNATLTPLTWVIAGTLLGFAETRQTGKIQRPTMTKPTRTGKPALKSVI